MDGKLIIDLESDFIKDKIAAAKLNLPQRNFEKFEIEEIAYRVYLCKECLNNGKCPYCDCHPLDKMTDLYSCNDNQKFPKRHSTAESWERFKNNHNIQIK